MDNIYKIKPLDLEIGDIEKEHDEFNKSHPKLRHLSIDLESVPHNGSWRATQIVIFDHQEKEVIMDHYIDYGDGSFLKDGALPIKEILRRVKIFLHNSVALMWNADADLEAMPQIELYALSVQCVMTRFSRVMNTEINSYFQDRPFLKLKDAGDFIGLTFEPHVCSHDARAASDIWSFCDRHLFPRDYEISRLLEEKISKPLPIQLVLEFREDELGFNYQPKANLKALRERFRKPKPFYKLACDSRLKNNLKQLERA